MSHKHCVFCGEELPVPRPTSFSTVCLAVNNTTQPDTSGNRHHAFLIGKQSDYRWPEVQAEKGADLGQKKCGCVHGDSDPNCKDPNCPNFTPSGPAAETSVEHLWAKKYLPVKASQWFKNGDHPLDYSRDHQGFENGELRTFTAAERREKQWEGDIVRYFRRPDVAGETICKQCGKTMHVHGWIDTLEGGHIVCPGDWIITGIRGEQYPCKPDIFAATYEPAAPPSAPEKTSATFDEWWEHRPYADMDKNDCRMAWYAALREAGLEK